MHLCLHGLILLYLHFETTPCTQIFRAFYEMNALPTQHPRLCSPPFNPSHTVPSLTENATSNSASRNFSLHTLTRSRTSPASTVVRPASLRWNDFRHSATPTPPTNHHFTVTTTTNFTSSWTEWKSALTYLLLSPRREFVATVSPSHICHPTATCRDLYCPDKLSDPWKTGTNPTYIILTLLQMR